MMMMNLITVDEKKSQLEKLYNYKHLIKKAF